MASFDGVYTRYLLRTGVVEQRTSVAAGTPPVAIRMRYISNGTVTSVTTITGTSIATVSVETSGTVTKTYNFATYTTIRSLIGAINADGLFQAKVLDALLSDATASQFTNGAITSGTDSNGVISWDVTVDAATVLFLTATLTGNRDWDTNWFNAEKVGQHRAVLQEIDYFATLGAAASNMVRIYIRRGKPGSVEVQKFGALSVSATTTAINFASGNAFMSGKDGDEIIVRLMDGTSISDTSAYIRGVGYLE